jgi:hypothetical protein
MATVRFDTRFPFKRTIQLLSDRAFRLHVGAICWSAEYKTAGVVIPQMLNTLTGGSRSRGRRAALELVEAGLWELLDSGDYRILPGFFTVDRAPKYSNGQRERIYERDGHRCVLCGSTDDLTLDHIYPRALAGDDNDDNLRTLCRPCNSEKGARI